MFHLFSNRKEKEALLAASHAEIKGQEIPRRICSYLALGIGGAFEIAGIALVASDNDDPNNPNPSAIDRGAAGVGLMLSGALLLTIGTSLLIYSVCRQKSREKLFDHQIEKGERHITNVSINANARL